MLFYLRVCWHKGSKKHVHVVAPVNAVWAVIVFSEQLFSGFTFVWHKLFKYLTTHSLFLILRAKSKNAACRLHKIYLSLWYHCKFQKWSVNPQGKRSKNKLAKCAFIAFEYWQSAMILPFLVEMYQRLHVM